MRKTPSTQWRLLPAAALLATFSATTPATGHEGHADAPGEGAATTSGPVTITAAAKRNLGITVEEAEVRSLRRTLAAIGQIEAIPDRSVAIASRIPGRVTALSANDGQEIAAGAVVVEIESRQLGDPPPRVKLEAPRGGTVLERHILVGDSVEPDEHLVEIADLGEVYVEGHLFEGQVARVRPGQTVRARVESFSGRVFEGTVERVSGSLDPQTRTLKVWSRIQNPTLELRPNMRARLAIVTDETGPVVAVPHSAVLGEAGHYFVFVEAGADGLTFERRPVVLGLKDDSAFEVVEGVFPGDRVVTVGNYQLQYVTASHPAGEEAGHGAGAPADAGGDAAAGGGAAAALQRVLDLPLRAMALTLAVLLSLNLVALLLKRPRHRGEAATPPPQPAPSTGESRS